MSKDLQLAQKAADSASEVILRHYQKEFEVNFKSVDQSMVTSADKEAEQAIIQVLKEGGDYPVLGEESGSISGKGSLTWIVDPIDGTTNFVKGIPFFSISIALVDMMNHDFLIGVVKNPVTGECYYAEKGQGSFLNGTKITVSDTSKPQHALAILNRGNGAEWTEHYNMLTNNFGGFTLRRLGSTALELCYLARGAADVFVNAGDKVWDFAAGIVIAREAGGTVTDWKGNEFTDGEFLVASNGILHNEVLDIL